VLDPDPLPEGVDIAVDLEIASVFKPRPFRRRAVSASTCASSVGQPSRRAHKVKHKKHQPWHNTAAILAPPGATSPPYWTADMDTTIPAMTKQEAKAANRRAARDKRREQKRGTLLALIGQPNPALQAEAQEDRTSDHSKHDSEEQISGELVAELEALHVATETAPLDINKSSVDTIADDSAANALLTLGAAVKAEPSFGTHIGVAISGCSPEADVGAGDVDAGDGGGHSKLEPRLIVEALVVRKMSLQEAFLDFGGFSLI